MLTKLDDQLLQTNQAREEVRELITSFMKQVKIGVRHVTNQLVDQSLANTSAVLEKQETVLDHLSAGKKAEITNKLAVGASTSHPPCAFNSHSGVRR